MIQLAAITATITVLVLLSLFAARRIAPGKTSLPMQWKPDGTPNWSLPRNAALAVTPLFATLVLVIAGFVDRTGQALPFICAAFIGAHLLHLFLLAKRG